MSMSNKELAVIAKKMSAMSKGERASKYLELSDQGISENIAGFLAFGSGNHQVLADELEDKANEMTPAARKDALALVRVLRG